MNSNRSRRPAGSPSYMSRETIIDTKPQDLHFRISFSPGSSQEDLSQLTNHPHPVADNGRVPREDGSSSCPEDEDGEDSSPCHSEYSDNQTTATVPPSGGTRQSQDQATRSMSNSRSLRRITKPIPASRGSAKRGDSPTLPSGSPPILPSAISPSEYEILHRSGDSARRSRRREESQINGGSAQSRKTNDGRSFRERMRTLDTGEDKWGDLSEGEITEFSEDD